MGNESQAEGAARTPQSNPELQMFSSIEKKIALAAPGGRCYVIVGARDCFGNGTKTLYGKPLMNPWTM